MLDMTFLLPLFGIEGDKFTKFIVIIWNQLKQHLILVYRQCLTCFYKKIFKLILKSLIKK